MEVAHHHPTPPCARPPFQSLLQPPPVLVVPVVQVVLVVQVLLVELVQPLVQPLVPARVVAALGPLGLAGASFVGLGAWTRPSC